MGATASWTAAALCRFGDVKGARGLAQSKTWRRILGFMERLALPNRTTAENFSHLRNRARPMHCFRIGAFDISMTTEHQSRKPTVGDAIAITLVGAVILLQFRIRIFFRLARGREKGDFVPPLKTRKDL